MVYTLGDYDTYYHIYDINTIEMCDSRNWEPREPYSMVILAIFNGHRVPF